MISVDEALAALFALAKPLGTETVELRQAAGRVLAEDALATRAQPPFTSSSMDGYALASEDATQGATLTMIGESAAGHAFEGTAARGQCVRIFTGAPLPPGTDHVEIQENVTADGDRITLNDPHAPGSNKRARGSDFAPGDALRAPRTLSAADISLLASMNVPRVTVARRPEVALISTGDELVMPGEEPGPDQIISSNGHGLDALLRGYGALPRLLPIARDTADSLASAFRFAKGADLIVTIGGASVGDHDLVRHVAGQAGMEQSFYKVAMRPGKPLMAGRLNGTPIIGLPGNPVSAMVCGHIFLAPVIRAMLGLPAGPTPRLRAPIAAPLGQNGPREHYMRAQMKDGALTAFERQDSSLLRILSDANALIVRSVSDGPRDAGDTVEYIPLSPYA
ncbi:MAG: gephyrin-like molybdotransferase Glp [Pseudomonadota bacterium]